MACDAGYLRGRPEEIEASKVLALLEELETGKLPVMCYGHGDWDKVHELGATKVLEEKVPELCGKLKTVDASQYSGEMQRWWEEHQRADRKREQANLPSNEPTIAQQLKIKYFPLEIYDSRGNGVYYEESTGYWRKSEFDSEGNRVYYEESTGFWHKYEYDSEGREIYFENSNGFWTNRIYDENGNIIYRNNSNGFWERWKYDTGDKVMHYENSIYHENSKADTIDETN